MKVSELEYLSKKIEDDFSDELQERINHTYQELLNINKKINWEVKKCSEFDTKVQGWHEQNHLEFISKLSKKILNKRKNMEN